MYIELLAIPDVWFVFVVWVADTVTAGYVGAGAGGGGAEDPAFGWTGVKAAPFKDVVPCI